MFITPVTISISAPRLSHRKNFACSDELLLREKIAAHDDILRPESASDEDLLRVHTPDWVSKLKTGTLSASEIMKLEVPYSPEFAEAVWLAAGGTILAAQLALRDGFARNLSGGFHHAYANHGEGFCAIHDVAVAVRRLQPRRHKESHRSSIPTSITAMALPQFSATIPASSPFLSISGTTIPADKPPSNVDLNMPDGVGDREYLAALLPAVQQHLDEFYPDMLFYVGGADPYTEDQLGGLSLTMEGLKRRDREVFEAARSRGIPVTTALAGGYARRVEDTVAIHVNTIIAAREVAEKYPHAREPKSHGAAT